MKKNKIGKFPVVDIERIKMTQHGFVARGKRWSVTDLLAAVEEQKLEPFSVPLASISLGYLPWNDLDFDDFIYHMKRVNDADDSNPIIYDECGVIADGWHRIAKRILKGKKTIMAVRLKEMPQNCTNVKNDD